MTELDKLHVRLIDSVGFDKTRNAVAVRFNDGDVCEATLDALEVPTDKRVEAIRIDEFRRGIEIQFVDGSMHDVSADYITWLTRPDYAAAYPADAALGPRVGTSIRELRKVRRIAQAALADMVGMQPPNLSRLEAGKHVPTLDVLLRVANALDVSLSALLGSANVPRTRPKESAGHDDKSARRRVAGQRRAAKNPGTSR
jgi:transcriptional regulator with XRE-family HTH domain